MTNAQAHAKPHHPPPALWAYLFELGTAGIAAGLWFVMPQVGGWPLLIAAAPWVVRLLTGLPAARRSGYEWPLLLFGVTAAISIWSAYDRETAWTKWWLLVAALVVMYALAQHSTRLHWSMLALAGLGVALTFYFLATHDWDLYEGKLPLIVTLGKALQAPLPSLPGEQLHPNIVGGMLALLLPFAGGATLAQRGWVRYAAAAAAIVIAFGLLMSRSRGAWLATAAVIGVVLLWQLLGKLLTAQRRRMLLAAGLGMALLLVAVLLLFVPEQIVSVPQLLLGDSGRVRLYREGLVLALDYPLIGAGLGSFQMLHATYAMLIHVGFSTHAHNLLLDVSIEQGLFGVLALLMLWGIVAGRLYWQAVGPLALPAVTGALALLTVVVHGLFDDVLYSSRGAVLLFVPLAFVGAVARPRLRRSVRQLRRRQQQIAATVAGVLLLMLVVGFQRPLRAIANANWAAVQQSKAELSVYVWPEWPIQDALRRALDLSAVRSRFDRALVLSPGLPSANRRQGQILLSLGQYERARELLATAYAARPWDTATRQLYGEALIVTGDTAGGAALWDGLDMAQGQLMGRTYWYGSIGESERQAAIEAAGQ